MMKKLAKRNCLRIIDPSMTDNGVLISSIDKNFPKEMTNLLKATDYILPNITEACLFWVFLILRKIMIKISSKKYPKN